MGIAAGQGAHVLREAQGAAFFARLPIPEDILPQGGKYRLLGPVHQGDGALWRVMLIAHAGGQGFFVRLQGAQDAARQGNLRAQDALDHFLGDAAGPEDRWLAAGQIQHRGLQTHLAGAAVQDQRDASVHILQHMLRCGGGWAAGPVGAGGGDWQAAGLQQIPGAGHGGHPHRDGGEPGRDLIRDFFCTWKEHRQGTGPEGVHQGLRAVGDFAEAFQLSAVPDMDDQRIIRRAALGRKDGQDGCRIQGIGAQPVDGFRREGYQPAFRKKPGRQGNGFRRRGGE